MIEVVSEKNLSEILPLISAYQAFYKTPVISDERNKAFFSQFGPSSTTGCQFLFRQNKQAIAFASVFFNYSSTLTKKVGVLNDLYVEPDYRKKGIAKQLIQHCRDFSRDRGCARLQWLTAQNNETAQKLYDSLNTNKSTWCLYTYKNQ